MENKAIIWTKIGLFCVMFLFLFATLSSSQVENFKEYTIEQMTSLRDAYVNFVKAPIAENIDYDNLEFASVVETNTIEDVIRISIVAVGEVDEENESLFLQTTNVKENQQDDVSVDVTFQNIETTHFDDIEEDFDSFAFNDVQNENIIDTPTQNTSSVTKVYFQNSNEIENKNDNTFEELEVVSITSNEGAVALDVATQESESLESQASHLELEDNTGYEEEFSDFLVDYFEDVAEQTQGVIEETQELQSPALEMVKDVVESIEIQVEQEVKKIEEVVLLADVSEVTDSIPEFDSQPSVDPVVRGGVGEQMGERILDESIEDDAQIEEPQQLNHAKGRFVIKFKSEGDHALNECAHCLLAKNKKFQDAVTDGSDSIDKLNAHCKVSGAKGLFFKKHNKTTHEAKQHLDQMIQTAKTKFSDRSERIDPGAQTPDLTNTYVMEVPANLDIEKVCELFSDDPHVEYAHPDYVMKADLTPNDTFYSSLWNVTKMQMESAWDLEQGLGIVVGVVDTGVDWVHSDLVTNIWSNTSETVNGSDSDGNGYVDDVRGYDFTTCVSYDAFDNCVTAKSPDNNPTDVHGHGTHVSGTIAAIGNNSTGIIGIAPQAKIMPLKALSDDGSGLSSELAEAIVYGANNGVDVINNSWGCVNPCPSNPTTESAVQTAHGLGVVVVFSAGNETDDVANYSPQNKSTTITVAASDQSDNKATFSNYGSLLDVTAPGVSIWSSTPSNTYSSWQGTSMAAPHVAGLAALILAEYPTYSNEKVRTVLRKTADDVETTGFDINSGYGRINGLNALTLTTVSPVLTSVGNKSVVEASNLAFTVTATDPNSDTTTMTALLSNANPLSTIGATYTDNGDNTASFSWTPALGQSGTTQTLVFTTTDPDTFLDQETITISVTPANLPPILTAIGSQFTVDGDVLSFAVAATDPNADALTLSALLDNGNALSSIGATFTDNGDGTGNFSWTSDIAQLGASFGIDFTVTDSGSATDTERVTVTVADVGKITSPVDASTLSSSSITFQWSAGTNVTQYWLGIGTSFSAVSTPPYFDTYGASQGTNTSVTLSNIVPIDDNPVYVRLWTQINGQWYTRDYMYSTLQADTPATLTAPVIGTTLSTTTTTFSWTQGKSVTEYWLKIGTTSGAGDVYDSSQGTATSVTISELPLQGNLFYVTLRSKISGVFNDQAYVFTTAIVSPEITSPAPASTVSLPTTTFQWSSSVGVTQFWLTVGTSLGDSDIFAQAMGTSTSVAVSSITIDGSPIYVTLQYLQNGTFSSDDYVFQTAISPNACGELVVVTACGNATLPVSPVGIVPASCPTGCTGSVFAWCNANGTRDTTIDGCVVIPVCGDSVVGSGEGCDDGNTSNGDGCSSSCQTEVCGNGTVDSGEGCDDGNIFNNDGCSSVCVLEPFCGDGIIDSGEACDDGNSVSGDGCSSLCVVEAFCGDGNLDPSESCDDGNTVGGDGCAADCSFDPFCGDGSVDSGESCDDGNTANEDGCSSACVLEICGDSVIQAGLGETCDSNSQSCTTSTGYAGTESCNGSCTGFGTCSTTEFCGDSVINGTEVCDDGSSLNGQPNQCNSGCTGTTASVCGNSIVESGESCDDGNTDPVDGCDSSCQIGATCGDNVCESGETFLNCFSDCVAF